jgi:hypothetical protein
MLWARDLAWSWSGLMTWPEEEETGVEKLLVEARRFDALGP